MQAPFRYLGSKHRLVPWLLDHFPTHTTYVEPFGGSGAVLLNKTPAPVEVFNDLNGDVVTLQISFRAIFQQLTGKVNCVEEMHIFRAVFIGYKRHQSSIIKLSG